MIIFAPVPLRCPSSCGSNGCQVLFGLAGIKPSLPCCVLIYCLRHFHIWLIFSGPVKLGASVALWSGFGWGARCWRAGGWSSQAICKGVTQQPLQQLLGKQGDWDPSARHLPVIALFPQDNKGSPPEHKRRRKCCAVGGVFCLPRFCLVIM